MMNEPVLLSDFFFDVQVSKERSSSFGWTVGSHPSKAKGFPKKTAAMQCDSLITRASRMHLESQSRANRTGASECLWFHVPFSPQDPALFQKRNRSGCGKWQGNFVFRTFNRPLGGNGEFWGRKRVSDKRASENGNWEVAKGQRSSFKKRCTSAAFLDVRRTYISPCGFPPLQLSFLLLLF